MKKEIETINGGKMKEGGIVQYTREDGPTHDDRLKMERSRPSFYII